MKLQRAIVGLLWAGLVLSLAGIGSLGVGCSSSSSTSSDAMVSDTTTVGDSAGDQSLGVLTLPEVCSYNATYDPNCDGEPGGPLAVTCAGPDYLGTLGCVYKSTLIGSNPKNLHCCPR